MAEEKKYIIGDFEYTLLETRVQAGAFYLDDAVYAGATGVGSVATLPGIVVLEGDKYLCDSMLESAVSGKQIETVIADFGCSLRDMPILKEVVCNNGYKHPSMTDCPLISRVVVNSEKCPKVVEISGNAGPVEVVYNKNLYFDSFTEEKDKTVAGDNIHAIFGDEVTEIGIIRGGHVTLGNNVKGIEALKKAEMGLNADTTVKEYELPTRIDFLSAEPPVVGTVAPGSMTVAELHVPNGALDAYMNHAQWGKAAYFVEEGGKTVDKYASRHKARMKKLQKEREEAEAKAAERAKKEKVKAMGSMMHSTMAPQRLAKWNPKLDHDWRSSIDYNLNVGNLIIKVRISKDAPIDIYDKIVARLEYVEAELNK